MAETHEPPRVEVLPLEKAAVSDSESASTPISRPKRKLPRSAWKPGQSGNPAGRKPDSQSWAGVIREITNMSPEDIARMVGRDNDLGRAFLQMPRAVQIKYLIIARTIAALMFDPSKGLLDTIMDRDEGKVTQSVDVTSGGKPIKGYVGISPEDWNPTDEEK